MRIEPKILELQIVETETGAVVKSFNVTSKTEKEIERLENGIGINLNWDKYHIKRSDI